MSLESNPLMVQNSIFEAAWFAPTSILIVGIVIGLLIGFFSVQRLRRKYTKTLEDLLSNVQKG